MNLCQPFCRLQAAKRDELIAAPQLADALIYAINAQDADDRLQILVKKFRDERVFFMNVCHCRMHPLRGPPGDGLMHAFLLERVSEKLIQLSPDM